MLKKWALLAAVLLTFLPLFGCVTDVSTTTLTTATIPAVRSQLPAVPRPTTFSNVVILSPEPSAIERKGGWSAFTNGNDVNALLVRGNELWAATSGGIVRFNIEEGTYRKYTTLDGLANNDVHAITQDSEGNIWFGTNGGGVSLYDGTSWCTLTTKDGLVSDYVSVITLDNRGNLWFGSFCTELTNRPWSGARPGGFSIYDGTKWNAVNGSGYTHGYVSCVFQDKDENIWLVFGDGGVICYRWQENGELAIIKTLSIPRIGAIQAVAQDRQGNLWFGGSGYGTPESGYHAVACYDGTNLVDIPFGVIGVLAIYQDSKGNLWFGTDNYGVWQYDGEYWLRFTVANGLSGTHFSAITEDSKGYLWFATDNGLTCYDGEKWLTYITSDEPLNNELLHNGLKGVFLDRKGNLWLATQCGLMSYDGNRWSTITMYDGLDGECVQILGQDNKENLWVVFRSGTYYYDGSYFHNFKYWDALEGRKVSPLATDEKGTIWFKNNDSGGGVSSYDGTSWRTYTTVQGLCSNYVDDIFSDTKGNIWVTTGSYRRGISRYDGTVWSTYSSKDGLVTDVVFDAAQDNQGRLWFATASGVSCFDGKTWSTSATWDALSKNTIGNDYVTSVEVDGEGNVWFGTYGGGVSYYDSKSWHTLTTRDGLCSDYVTTILKDNQGKLWFATSAGISRYDPELEDIHE